MFTNFYKTKDAKEILQNAQKFNLVDNLLNSENDIVLTAREREFFVFMKVHNRLAMVQTDDQKEAERLEKLADGFNKYGTSETQEEIEK